MVAAVAAVLEVLVVMQAHRLVAQAVLHKLPQFLGQLFIILEAAVEPEVVAVVVWAVVRQ